MTERGYPSVYTVDTHTTRPPPLPPRLNQKRQNSGAAQTLLFLLDTSGSHSKHSADVLPPSKSLREVLPSKPVAHLTGGQDVVHKKEIMAWSMDADPILYEMDYKDRSLVIQTEGYYYVYSKVSFLDIDAFYHSVHVKTKRYKGKSIPLLLSRTKSQGSSRKEIRDQKTNSEEYSRKESLDQRSNSYLGGVFHLFKGDTVFVKVSNTSQIVELRFYENFFGTYMI
ncbi:tumor necrosis factor ligand superfamily member 14 isoform X2 [Notolabrus celidotus]|uniref:tumor necrosis factor ligand superfamily member 14 isoform X2 n=1 Tax=Notolabrus celidotus TaxID=1203425 RepID=UPI00148F8954|nr:tumor necrosis factor ligand superfamily member 14 isoform X2 [Notolabrus celidotus]